MEADTALQQEASWAARAMIANNPSEEQNIKARHTSYRPKFGRDYQCPKCWMRDSIRSSMRSVPGTDEYDILRCNRDNCSADVIIPL